MLNIRYVTDTLQNELHKDGRITFKVTDVMQHWYNYGVKDADGNNYAPAVVRALPMPVLMDNYSTRVLMYEVNIKGLESQRETIEDIINNLKEFTVDGNKWKLHNFIASDIGAARDRFEKVSEFVGSFRVNIFVPLFVTGNDVKIKINGTDVDEVGLGAVFDKALIPNVAFGDNNSQIATGETFTITFPISNNPLITDIFSNVISDSFNKLYTFTFDFVVVEKAVELALTGGNINYRKDNNAISFNAEFQRALPRTSIKINNYDINVIGFTPQTSIVPAPRNDGSETKIRANTYSSVFSFQLENDGSYVADEIIKEINKHENKKFTVEYDVNGETYTHDCVMLNGSIASAENPNAVMQVTLGVGAFG